MTVYYLAAGSTGPSRPAPIVREPIPKISLESMDGLVRVKLDDTMGWILMPGATGLEMAPTTSFYRRMPGVHGAIPAGFRAPERKIFLPLYVRGDTQRAFRERMSQMVNLIDPHTRAFKLIVSTVSGVRELTCRYDAGLEGNHAADVSGLNWAKIPLQLTAFHPFARARNESRLVFQTANTTDEPFMGVVGGTDAPWPAALSNSAVIGDGMEVFVSSEVPVHPRLDLIGPMDSFASSMVVEDDVYGIGEWQVDIPNGVPAGSSFTLVTDGHQKSMRLDGNLAAGRVALGSKLRPFQRGTNILNVAAPGGNADTRIIISWYDQYWSLW